MLQRHHSSEIGKKLLVTMAKLESHYKTHEATHGLPAYKWAHQNSINNSVLWITIMLFQLYSEKIVHLAQMAENTGSDQMIREHTWPAKVRRCLYRMMGS